MELTSGHSISPVASTWMKALTRDRAMAGTPVVSRSAPISDSQIGLPDLRAASGTAQLLPVAG